MRIKTVFIGILGASFAFNMANAAEVSPGASTLPAVGTFKCTLYNDHKGDIGQIMMLSWAQGQMSGTDIIRTSILKQKSLRGIIENSNQFTEILNNTCSKNPDSPLYQATAGIYFNLNSALLEKPKEEQGDDATYLNLGVGNETCDFFNTHRKENIGSLVISWMQGELVGLDVGIISGTMRSGMLSKVSDKNTLNNQFAKECRIKPSQKISAAGVAVFASIVQKFSPKDQ